VVGQTLGSRYEIIAKLGSGGMSHVYQARCTILNRIVTVKTLRRELAEDKEFVRRFQVEAQAVASLSHPNIVSIYDVGEENGVPYLVMEYVEGLNLKEIINKDGPLSPAETINLGVQVCAALAHAHEKGIIHRDIKSQNILVTPGGRVKVTDFGLARVLSIPSATVTRSGTVMGSVHYFSPEQARGEETGPRSDLYSLGVVLYEAVSGRLPFQADNPVTVALKHLRDAPAPLNRDNPAVPQRLEEIIFKALAKDPEQRWQTAREMQQALSESSLLAANGASEDEMTRELQLPAGVLRTRRRLRPAALASVIFLVLLLAGGTYAFSRWFLRGGEIPVPKVTGLTQQVASETIEATGLKPSVQMVFDDKVDAGIVVGQEPVDGYPVKRGRPVILRVSKGPNMTWLPDVKGYKVVDARIKLQNLGFSVKEVEDNTSDPDTPPGVVTGINPTGEQNVPSKSEIVLTVSKQTAANSLLVPSLVGLTVEQARAMLASLSLTLGEVRDERSQDYPAGFISRQDVSQGTPAQTGMVVDVVRSLGPGPKKQSIPVNLRVNETGEVKVVVEDALGSRVVYQQTHNAGYVLKKQYDVWGAGAIKIYFKGDPNPVTTIPFN
jgi:beta-lactam-binding protein with PASTA domain/tRNA A-37 threonylcarbamoyl transferase component Bud32